MMLFSITRFLNNLDYRHYKGFNLLMLSNFLFEFAEDQGTYFAGYFSGV
jgi:hypothetical protein